MVIYHGSKVVVTKPIIKGSNSTNDYGPSFYMTIDLDAAKSWACKNNTLGIVNEYRIDNKKFDKLKVLDLTNKTKYNVLNWLAILMHFRELNPSFIKQNKMVLDWLEKYYINVDEYDVVIGFRADDSYFRFPINFISNNLSYNDLEDVFLSGNLGVQYAFMSGRAIRSLIYNGAIGCEEKYLMKHYSTITKATHDFDEIISRPRDQNKKYVLDLMREDNER